MAKIERFEDIDCWKEARTLVEGIYSLTRKEEFSRDWGLKDQIQRAAVSIMSNIAEGYESQTNKEFVQYLYHAKKSAAEVRSQLYVALDLRYVSAPDLKSILDRATKLAKMISNFISYLRSCRT